MQNLYVYFAPPTMTTESLLGDPVSNSRMHWNDSVKLTLDPTFEVGRDYVYGCMEMILAYAPSQYISQPTCHDRSPAIHLAVQTVYADGCKSPPPNEKMRSSPSRRIPGMSIVVAGHSSLV